MLNKNFTEEHELFRAGLKDFLKLLATLLSDKVTTQCLQMFGGFGYMESFPMAVWGK